ncbi:hypothetical protein H5410_051206 [Solanum commersonii]|uniref:Uncharacterized protein n=1 Tax=Solanum commersonii TaxID=4109 RepID=A0A9J5WXQ7_SOLCO|nr:hypothetical protein H5410_051206 [Solanum commersonii]
MLNLAKGRMKEKMMMVIWIYEVFLNIGKYAGKSLDSLLPISCFLRWHTPKSNNIMEDCTPIPYPYCS